MGFATTPIGIHLATRNPLVDQPPGVSEQGVACMFLEFSHSWIA